MILFVLVHKFTLNNRTLTSHPLMFRQDTRTIFMREVHPIMDHRKELHSQTITNIPIAATSRMAQRCKIPGLKENKGKGEEIYLRKRPINSELGSLVTYNTRIPRKMKSKI